MSKSNGFEPARYEQVWTEEAVSASLSAQLLGPEAEWMPHWQRVDTRGLFGGLVSGIDRTQYPFTLAASSFLAGNAG